MCIIIDANVFGSVFNTGSKYHIEFKPIRDWIIEKDGRVVYGGTKYIKELCISGLYKLYKDLRVGGRASRIDKELVDRKQREIELILSHPDFNDAHIIALVITSGCRLVCTQDKSFYPFLKNRRVYPQHFKTPKIYSGKKNRGLISKKSLKEICNICKNEK
jgi:rRNA-processing protein FCF1